MRTRVRWLKQSPPTPGYVILDFRIHRSGWFYLQINRLVVTNG